MDSPGTSCLIIMSEVAAVSRDKGSRSFKGVGFIFSNEYPRDCFQSGNAIADNESILYLLTEVLYVQSAVGVFMHPCRN